MKHVTIYSKPGCAACWQTRKLLAQRGVDMTEIDITTNPEAEQHVRDKAGGAGRVEMPLVEVDSEHWWWGFRLDRIRGL